MFDLDKIKKEMITNGYLPGGDIASESFQLKRIVVDIFNEFKQSISDKDEKQFLINFVKLKNYVIKLILSGSQSKYLLELIELEERYDSYYKTFKFDRDSNMSPEQIALSKINGNILNDAFLISNAHKMHVLDGIVELSKILNITFEDELLYNEDDVVIDKQIKNNLLNHTNISDHFQYMINPDEINDVNNPLLQNMLK